MMNRISLLMCAASLASVQFAAEVSHADPLRDWAKHVSPPRPANETLTIATGERASGLTLKGTEPCFAVDRINVQGLELIESDVLQTAVEPLAHNCLGNTLVKAMLVKINGLHAAQGYITTQAYLPKQDIKRSRQLNITIRTGRIEAVTYSEKPAWAEGTYWGRLGRAAGAVYSAATVELFFAALDRFTETIDDPLEPSLVSDSSARTATSFVVTSGDVLELEALQQGLDQMNRAPSSKAKVKLEAGKEPATSHLNVTNTPTDTFRLTVGYDTYGTEATGIERGRVAIARDNLIGINDTWSAGLTSARNTNELSAGFSMPLGWMTFAAGAVYSESLIELAPTAELFNRSFTWNADLSATIVRMPKRRLDVTGGVKVWHNKRYVNSAELTPQRIFTIHLGAQHRWIIGSSAAITAGFNGYLGLDAMGATRDLVSAGTTDPRAQYRKATANLDVQWKPLPGIMLTSNLLAQWANTPLYSDTQLTIGSTSSVRGFKDAPISIDRGGHWRNELSGVLPVDNMFKQAGLTEHRWLANRLKGLTGYVFIDAGYGENLASGTNDLLVGAGGGLRYRDSRITADFSVARGIHRDDHTRPKATEVYLNVGLKVF